MRRYKQTGGKNMNEFCRYHPIVNFCYFLPAIGFSMFFMHPVCLVISLVLSLCFCAFLGGVRIVGRNLAIIIPMAFIMAVINPLFSHEGATIITFFADGNPLTVESIIYGVAASLMIASTIMWFSCYNAVMTSDKFVYLFGRIIPSLSLIFSMTLRFVPRFVSHLRTVADAEKCIGRDMSEGSIIQRAKNGLSILSITATWALENAIETSDSMKARGYGLSGRSAFSLFTFGNKDAAALGAIVILGAYIVTGCAFGGLSYRYFPTIRMADVNFFEISLYIAYILLLAVPMIIELWEVRKWKLSK